MLNFDFLDKGLGGIVSPAYFVYDFYTKNAPRVIFY